MSIIPVDAFEIAPDNPIRHDFFRAQLPRSGRDALIVRFTGQYGVGSAGNGDARYMTAIVELALSFASPDCLVYDLTGLRYVWGDMMDRVLCAGRDYWHVPPSDDGDHWKRRAIDRAIVVSDQCEEAIVSLLTMEMEIEDLSIIHRDLQSALHTLDALLATQ